MLLIFAVVHVYICCFITDFYWVISSVFCLSPYIFHGATMKIKGSLHEHQHTIHNKASLWSLSGDREAAVLVRGMTNDC